MKAPAFYADLFEGDIVLSFNGIEVNDTKHMSSLIGNNAGITIELEVLRNGECY